jgi:DedD protein
MPHHPRTDAPVDPLLYERRRAQRRLIGALVLVLAAVITLPFVLDAQPQPAPHNVTIEVPKSLFETCKKRTEQAQKESNSLLPDSAALDALCDDSESHFTHTTNLGTARAQAPQRAANENTNVFIQTGPTKSAIASNTPAASAPSTSPSVSARTMPAPATKLSSAGALSSNANAAAPARFFIHIGHFSNLSQAQAWIQKLQKSGFSASLEAPKNRSKGEAPNGPFALRIGPFNDKVSAQRALERIEKLGLPTKR